MRSLGIDPHPASFPMPISEVDAQGSGIGTVQAVDGGAMGVAMNEPVGLEAIKQRLSCSGVHIHRSRRLAAHRCLRAVAQARCELASAMAGEGEEEPLQDSIAHHSPVALVADIGRAQQIAMGEYHPLAMQIDHGWVVEQGHASAVSESVADEEVPVATLEKNGHTAI